MAFNQLIFEFPTEKFAFAVELITFFSLIICSSSRRITCFPAETTFLAITLTASSVLVLFVTLGLRPQDSPRYSLESSRLWPH